jgi:hypothetical protein
MARESEGGLMTDWDALTDEEKAPSIPEPDGYVGPMASGNDPQFEIVGICHRCRHLRKDFETCDAFPSGIPNEVAVGEFIHTRQYPGDNGITFEAKGGID